MMKVNSNSTRTFIPRENELSDFSLGSVLLLFKMRQRNSGDLSLFHLKLKRNAIYPTFIYLTLSESTYISTNPNTLIFYLSVKTQLNAKQTFYDANFHFIYFNENESNLVTFLTKCQL